MAVAFAREACATFTPSQHKNARRRQTGAASVCVNCHKPQSQHWLRQALSERTRADTSDGLSGPQAETSQPSPAPSPVSAPSNYESNEMQIPFTRVESRTLSDPGELPQQATSPSAETVPEKALAGVQDIAAIAWRCIKQCRQHEMPPVMCVTHQLEAENLLTALQQSHGDQLRTLADAMRLTVQRPTLGLVNKVNKWAGILDTLASPAPSPVSAPSGVSLAPDLARDPFGIGLLLDSMGKDREFAESCLLAVIRVCQKHFGDDAVRVSSGQLAAFLDEMLSKASPAPSPVSAQLQAVAELVSRYHADETKLSAAETLLAIGEVVGIIHRGLRGPFTDADLRAAGQDWGDSAPAPSPVSAWQPTKDEPTQHWAVMVERNGANVVTIESNFLAGRDLSDEDKRVVELAATHLLSFLGLPVPLSVERE